MVEQYQTAQINADGNGTGNQASDKTAADEVYTYIHPRCVGVIQSLERTQWVDKNPNTATIDKTEGIEHFSDGVRYGFEYLFPIVSHTKRTSRGSQF